jgi:hypothetical protein
MKKYIFFVLYILMHNFTSNAMQTTFCLKLLTKGVTGISTFVHFGYFAKQIFLSAIPFEQYGSSVVRPPNERTEKFVKDVLSEVHYPQEWVKKTKVHIINPNIIRTFCADINSIIVPVPFDEQFKEGGVKQYPPYIQSMLDGNGLNEKFDKQMRIAILKGLGVDEEPYLASKAMIVHEAGHVYHKHQVNRSLSALFSVCVVHAGAKKLATFLQGFGSTVIKNQTLHSLCKSALRLGVGLPLKIAATLGLITLENRRQEKQADQEVIKRIQDPEVFEKAAQSFEAADVNNLLEAKKEYGDWIAQYPSLANFFIDPDHPRAQERAERFYKKADELRKVREIQKTIKKL